MRGVAALLAVMCGACASSVGTGGARVLATGQQEVGMAVDLSLPSAQLGPSQPVAGIWPQFGFGYRRGLGANFEAGARVWGFGLPRYLFTFGGGVDARYGIFRAPNIDEGYDLTLGAGVAYHQVNVGGAPTHLAVVQVPLLFGVNIGDGDQIYFGPRFEDHYFSGEDVVGVNSAFVGFSLGFVWRALAWLEVRPEVVALYSPVPFNGTANDEQRRGLGVLQFGISNAILPEAL